MHSTPVIVLLCLLMCVLSAQAQLEEYEQQHRQEIEDEQAKLDKEKEIIQA